MITRPKFWSICIAGCLAVLVIAALALPQSFQLTALSDVTQCFLLIAGTVLFIPHILKSQGRVRLFWGLITAGIGFWLLYQLLWTYFEIWLRKDVPVIFSGDLVLFLHIVPLIAALAMRPHIMGDEYSARLGHLDFALLLLWWVYAYALVVMSWQYALPNETAYSRNFNVAYLAEKVLFLAALTACWLTSRGPWRLFYGNLFGASVLYSTSSYVANWAIGRGLYYSGSLYDIPLAASMAWIALLAVWISAKEPHSEGVMSFPSYGVWIARSGMISVFSLPLFASWALVDVSVPAQVRWFRVIVTLSAALAMSFMVFIRQRLLDRELIRLLHHSEASLENLVQLQAQVLQSEKLASVGQLVGGAAHELNNPITAMLGYSDLLLEADLSGEQRSLAIRIGQNVRRTKSLVASLLSFARRNPATKTAIDLNTLARTAIKLVQPNSQSKKIDLVSDFDASLPKVLGDSNQLLQVCLQVIGGALYALEETAAHTLTVSSYCRDGIVGLRVSPGTDVAAENPSATAETDPMLGLSACQGIVKEHQGRLVCRRLESGACEIEVELPAHKPIVDNEQRSTEPGPAGLWQSQPIA